MRHTKGTKIQHMKATKKNTVKSTGNVGVNTSGVEIAVSTLKLAADLRQSHQMRLNAQNIHKVDLFALHALGKVSRAYIAYCASKAQGVIDALKGKDATHVLIANGVANKVTVGADGFYTRANGALTGNVDLLAKVHGKAIVVMTLAEMEKRFAEIKEVTKRRIGTGKSATEIEGKVIAETSDGYFVLAVRQNNGTLAFHNGEFGKNVYNKNVRAVIVQNAKVELATVAAK